MEILTGYPCGVVEMRVIGVTPKSASLNLTNIINVHGELDFTEFKAKYGDWGLPFNISD